MRFFILLILLFNFPSLFAVDNLSLEKQEDLAKLRTALNGTQSKGEKAKIYYEIGEVYAYYLVDSAVYYLNMSLEIFEELGNEKDVVTVKAASIEQLYIVGELWRSIQYAYDVEEYFISTGESAQMPSLYNSMGNNLKRQKDWRGAMKYYKISQKLSSKLDQPLYTSFSYMNLGECFWKLGILDSALESENKALAVMKEIGYNHQGYILGFIGRIQYDMGEKAEAFKNMKLGIDLSIRERGYERILTTLLNYIAECSLNEGENDSAIVYGRKAYILSSAIPVLLEKERSTEILANTFEASMEIDSAFKYMKLLANIKNEVERTAELIHARELKAQDDAKQEELKHVTEIGRKERTRNIFIASTLIILLLAGGLYTRVRFIRKANRTLEKAKNRAERSEAFKQQFLANMSHEIRTPMNAILGMTNLTLDTELTPQQKEYLTAVRKSSENLLVIINDILDLSKLEAGKMDLEFIPYHLKEQIRVVYDTLRFKAEEKGLVFETEFDEKLPEFIKGDPYRLNQILINLCGNSIKFTEKGRVTIKVSKEGQGIRFSVSDTGIGIPKEKADRLFKAFQQIDESTSRKYGGTGLGLSISKTLVELQQGKIGVNSEEGRGSEFYFTLPYEVASSQDIEYLLNKSDTDASKLKGMRILLVEDNKFNQVVLHDTLKHLIKEVHVDIAENGQIALDRLQANAYNVILMDVNMPVMNGHEATRYIRQKMEGPKKDTVILALTASVLSDDIEEFTASGMNGYIPKPFTREELISTLVKFYT